MTGWAFIYLVLASSLMAKAKLNILKSSFKYYPGVGNLKYHRTLRTWADASRACKDQKAHLVVANSADELAVIGNLVGQAVEPYSYAHVGHHGVVGGTFFSDDGSLVDGDSFRGGGPVVDALGRELCPVAGGFTSPGAGGLRLDLCSTKRPFICEREPHRMGHSLVEKVVKKTFDQIRSFLFD